MIFTKALNILLLIILLFLGCINIVGDCETTISKRLPNPSKTLQAVSAITDCGATTTPSSGLRIIEGNDPNDIGMPENTILGSGSGFDFHWKTNDTLVVKGADTASGYTMKTFYTLKKSEGQIVIVYKK